MYKNAGASGQLQRKTVGGDEGVHKILLTDFDGKKAPDLLGVRSVPEWGLHRFEWFESTNQYPRADFLSTPLDPRPGDTVYFFDQSSDSDGIVASRTWSFGDGDTSSGDFTSHVYQDTGTYTVRLTATDDSGATNRTVQTLEITLGGNDGGGARCLIERFGLPRGAVGNLRRLRDRLLEGRFGRFITAAYYRRLP